MNFYEIPERKYMWHILVYSMGTKATREKKLLSTTLHTPYLAEI